MDLTAKQIQKYSKYSTPELRKKAGIKFRKFIRLRDAGMQCCSCQSYNTTDASHLYSVGGYPALEFEPDNCWKSCKKCNLFLSGNIQEYRLKLIKNIGIERVERLDLLAAQYKRTGYKQDRFFLIEIITKYS